MYHFLDARRGTIMDISVMIDELKKHMDIHTPGAGNIPNMLHDVFDIKKENGNYVIPDEIVPHKKM